MLATWRKAATGRLGQPKAGTLIVAAAALGGKGRIMVTLATEEPAAPMQTDPFSRYLDYTTPEIEEIRRRFLQLPPDNRAAVSQVVDAFMQLSPERQRQMLQLFERIDADPNFAEEA